MVLDVERLRAIIAEPHSYYGSKELRIRKDQRLYPGTSNLLSLQFEPDMEVLDLGCGSGITLIELSRALSQGHRDRQGS